MSENKPFVLVTAPIPEAGIKILQEKVDLQILESPYNRRLEDYPDALEKADGLLCLLSDPITRELMDQMPRLKVISNYAVGYNNVDVAAATERGIAVTNTPGVLTDATADLAWALLLAAARRIVEGDRMVRNGEFLGWGPLLLRGYDLKGRTLGIAGAGRIGTAMALRSVGWEMPVVYYSRRPNEVLEKKLRARRVSKEELIKESDILSLHLPLTPETHHFIAGKEFSEMKPGAILINTARGPVIDENALVRALKNGPLAAAGLDVFEEEPKVHPELLTLKNVVLAPHIGSATYQTRDAMARIAAENLLAELQGRQAEFTVNREVYEIKRRPKN
ncbi:MAG: D-glycerate dehydrogenase [Calditrichia bacterium]